MTQYAIGLDIGSTNLKALLLSDDGDEVAEARRRTPWRSRPGGWTEMDASDLLAEVHDLFDELAARAPAAGVTAVAGIGISGMAEAGVLIDRADRVELPVVAWFDPRGADEVQRLDPDFRAEFTRRTGLPASPLATFAKLLHARAGGASLDGRQWLNLPEFVAAALGGGRYSEPSMRSRTGLVDQDTGADWAEALELLGAPELLPPVRVAGEPWGVAERVPPLLRGAVLTVAGHDHPVASVGAGCLAPADLYNSMGTAEALVRALPDTLDGDTRAELAAHHINVGAHLLPGRGVLIAGIKTGLVLRRLLQLIGVTDAAGRARLDELVMALPAAATATHALHITGAENSDGVLSVRADGDGLSPELFFAAALAHCTGTLAGVLARIDATVGPASRTVLSGGWSSMRSVRRARARVLPGLEVSERADGTVYGAAVIAAYATRDHPERDLIRFAREFATDRDEIEQKGSSA